MTMLLAYVGWFAYALLGLGTILLVLAGVPWWENLPGIGMFTALAVVALMSLFIEREPERRPRPRRQSRDVFDRFQRGMDTVSRSVFDAEARGGWPWKVE